MKKLLFVAMFLFSFFGYSQYRISTAGESKQFVFEDTSDGTIYNYPREYITARIMSSGNIIVFRNDGSNDGRSFAFSQSGGIAYTEFLDGNNSDATFANAQAVIDWFYDNTGFKTASGGSGASVSQDYYVQISSSTDNITDSDFTLAENNLGLFIQHNANDTITSGSISASNFFKPFVLQSVSDSLYFKLGDSHKFYTLGYKDTIPSNGYIIKDRSPIEMWYEDATTLFVNSDKITFYEETPYIGNNALDWNLEVNAVGDVAYESPADGSVSVIEGDAVHGIYFLRGAHNGNDGTAALRVSLADSNLIIGETYEVSFWAREASGTSAAAYISSGFVGDGTNLGSVPATWQKYTFTSEVDGADPGFSIFDGSNTSGDLIDYDFVTIKHIP